MYTPWRKYPLIKELNRSHRELLKMGSAAPPGEDQSEWIKRKHFLQESVKKLERIVESMPNDMPAGEENLRRELADIEKEIAKLGPEPSAGDEEERIERSEWRARYAQLIQAKKAVEEAL